MAPCIEAAVYTFYLLDAAALRDGVPGRQGE